MYEKVLTKLGLKTTEINAYVNLLSLGTQPASVLARHMNVPRTTMRVYLERLKNLGFVRMNWKNKIQYFTPEKPDQVIQNLEHKRESYVEKVNKNLNAFSAIMPELSTITTKDHNLPKVTFFEGSSEIKRMYQDSLTSESEIMCISSVEDLWDLFGKKYDDWYVTKRVKNNIPVRYVAKNTAAEKKERTKDKKFLRKSKLISEKLFTFSNEINIYDGKVSIITLKEEKIGVLIESKEIYHSMKAIFEILWLSGR